MVEQGFLENIRRAMSESDLSLVCAGRCESLLVLTIEYLASCLLFLFFLAFHNCSHPFPSQRHNSAKRGS